jgi:tryptophanyl-tRNA synthetase
MNDYENSQPRDSYFSKKIRAGKRTYYFDVKATRGNDYYITITESKRKPGESEDRPVFEKHKLFLYKEDFEKFAEGFQESLNYIREKTGDNPVMNNEYHRHEEPVSTQENKSFSDLDFDDLNK